MPALPPCNHCQNRFNATHTADYTIAGATMTIVSATFGIPPADPAGFGEGMVISGTEDSNGLDVSHLVVTHTDLGPPASWTVLLPPGDSLVGNIYPDSTLIDRLSSTANIQPGMTISGTGIPSGAVVVSIINNNELFISIPAAPISGNPEAQPLLFGTNYPLSGTFTVSNYLPAGRQCEAWNNVTAFYSTISAEIDISGTYAYLNSVSFPVGTDTETIVTKNNQSITYNKSVTLLPYGGVVPTDVLTAGWRDQFPALPDMSFLPPGDFIVLQCDDCCSQDFYVFLFGPSTFGTTGIVFFDEDPMTTTGTFNLASSRITTFANTPTSNQTIANSVVPALPFGGQALMQYTDATPYCNCKRQTSSNLFGAIDGQYDGGILSPSGGGFNQMTQTVTTSSGSTSTSVDLNVAQFGGSYAINWWSSPYLPQPPSASHVSETLAISTIKPEGSTTVHSVLKDTDPGVTPLPGETWTCTIDFTISVTRA